MKTCAPLLALLTLLAAHSLPAQPAQPVRVRGTVQSFDGHTLAVATTSGTVRLTVGDSTGINGLAKKSAADIGPNTFIGTTAVKDSKGRWRATEVHIFPDSMRGAGEGHYAWDLPESTMTNAAVTGTAAKRRGRTLHLKYSTNQGSPTGGEVDVDITKKTAIVALTAGERSLLVPGAAVFALAAPGQGGTANAIAIVAETKGVKPPM
jgi:hypothetical protein